MRFLVDAHLPRRLCAVLAQHGHDAMHTLDLERNLSAIETELQSYTLVEIDRAAVTPVL
jgi:predicted nuclease of predicted toxin-antitoxin system